MPGSVVLQGPGGAPDYAAQGQTGSAFAPANNANAAASSPSINSNDQVTGYTPTIKTSPVSTGSTVLSNANIVENTIPALNAKASTLSTQPATTLTPTQPPVPLTPNTDYGSLYQTAYDSLPDITSDPQYQQDMALINGLQTEGDDTTSAYVNSIQKNYLDLTNTQQQAAAASTARLQNALLMGGSSRYAPVSSGGILDLKTRGDLSSLSTLQDQENQKIAEVKQAQSNQDYNLMSKKMSELDTLRTNKQTLAKSIADSMLKTNQTALTSQAQNSQDNAVATLVQGGTTDPNEILQELTKQGYSNANLKDITTTLTAIVKSTGSGSLDKLSGGIGDYYTLKDSGNLPSSISSLPPDQQLFAFLKAFKAASTAPKATSTGPAASIKPLTSGTLIYTQQDYADDSKTLEASRGPDGFVDPALYQKLYTTWTAHGGKVADFLKTFPIKDYVNPANTTLPTYLRPAVKAPTAGAANPFG